MVYLKIPVVAATSTAGNVQRRSSQKQQAFWPLTQLGIAFLKLCSGVMITNIENHGPLSKTSHSFTLANIDADWN